MSAMACAAPRVERTPRRNSINRGLPMREGHPARAVSLAISQSAWENQSIRSFTKLSRRCARPCSPRILASPDRNFPPRLRRCEKDFCFPVFSRRLSNLPEASLLHLTLKNVHHLDLAAECANCRPPAHRCSTIEESSPATSHPWAERPHSKEKVLL